MSKTSKLRRFAFHSSCLDRTMVLRNFKSPAYIWCFLNCLFSSSFKKYINEDARDNARAAEKSRMEISANTISKRNVQKLGNNPLATMSSLNAKRRKNSLFTVEQDTWIILEYS